MASILGSSRHSRPARRSKYGNTRTDVDGLTFDSKAEANRYCVLRLLEKAGQIRDVRRQVPYRLDVNGMMIATYRADFVYFDVRLGRDVVEDVKSDGTRTPEYKLKRKLMLACHSIEIVEVT